MDIPGSTRSHWAKSCDSSPADRFLGVFLHAPPLSSSASVDELNEDDIFSCGDDLSGLNRHNNLSSDNHYSAPPSSSSSSSTPRLQHRGKKVSISAFGPLESFGILAALPENEPHSVFNHKASISSSSSSSASSSRVIPKPSVLPVVAQQERFSTAKYHQSAPVNVPVLPPAVQAAMRRRREFDEIDDDDGDSDGLNDDAAMLPPHEIVARSLARTPILSCSVLEGAGRTLKGRDLRQVRNAVFRRTGFID